MATEDQTKASAFNLAAQLRASNQRIIALENLIRSSPAAAKLIAGDVLKARQQQEALVQKFTVGYRMLYGTVPEGLTAIDLVTLGIVAGILGTVSYGLYALVRYLDVLEQRAQTAQLTATNQGTLLAQAAYLDQQATDARARGDLPLAADLSAKAAAARAQAGVLTVPTGGGPKPPGGTDFFSWIQQNWGWVLLGVGGVLVAPKVVEAL